MINQILGVIFDLSGCREKAITFYQTQNKTILWGYHYFCLRVMIAEALTSYPLNSLFYVSIGEFVNELIKIENRNGKETVNTRELYEFLEVKKDFSDWIKYRIKKYGFQEGEDFTTIQGKSTGGRPSIEYHVTIDMAKELSMVENNDKGREARRYFIECEKKSKNPELSSLSYYGESPLIAIAGIIQQYQKTSDATMEYMRQMSAKYEESRKEDREFMKTLLLEVTASKTKKSKYKLPPAKQLELENIGEDYYTIAAYQRIRKMSLYDTSSHGKILTGICNREGIPISSVKSTKFASVNSYPESVLKRYFDSMIIG